MKLGIGLNMAASLWCMILLTWYISAAGQQLSQWVDDDANYGPVVNVFCQSDSATSSFTWKFNHQTLTTDGKLVKADSTRYSVTIGDVPNRGYGSLLKIQNALKQDAGVYTCTSTATKDQSIYSSSKDITVIIDQYLPPPEFPDCKIIDVSKVNPESSRSEVSFTCLCGHASPPVNGRCILQTLADGDIKDLGNTPINSIIKFKLDGHALFKCFTTSDAFPQAPQGMCESLYLHPPK